jgi:hypothetical protein
MRILSKKKTTIKNQTRLVCENCGAIIRHALHGSYSLTTVSKDQAKRPQLEENFEIPNFNIDLVKTNIALNFDLNQENEDELGFGGNTARLKSSS